MTQYNHDDDRSTYPVLVVGRSYWHRTHGAITITAVLQNMHFGGVRYAYNDASGQCMGEQNDHALLNALRSTRPVDQQMKLF